MTPPATAPRRHVRTEVSFDATIEVDGHRVPCAIENISPGGAMVKTRQPLARGQAVTLSLGDMGQMTGTVAWAGRNSAGLKFDSDIDTIADLLMAVAIY